MSQWLINKAHSLMRNWKPQLTYTYDIVGKNGLNKSLLYKILYTRKNKIKKSTSLNDIKVEQEPLSGTRVRGSNHLATMAISISSIMGL